MSKQTDLTLSEKFERARVKESTAAEDPDEDDGKPMVTHAVARCSVQLLKHYFVEQGFNDNTGGSLDACADLLYSSAHASVKQTTLDSLFFFVVGLSFVVIMFVTSYQKFAYILGQNVMVPKWPIKAASTVYSNDYLYKKGMLLVGTSAFFWYGTPLSVY